MFNVSLMSAQEKQNKTENKTYPSQSNFINNSQEQMTALYWKKTTALCTKAELGKPHTECQLYTFILGTFLDKNEAGFIFFN